MGNFIDKIKNITGFEVDDPDEDIMDEEYNPEDDYAGYPPKTSERNESKIKESGRSGNVVSIPSSAANKDSAKAALQVVLAKPERFDDASAIADHLNAKRTVILNLESANRDVARRLIDFLSGVAYANNGQLKRVANSTFIITPYNVDVMGDLLDELENNGMFFQS